jgi:hypothetical protein
MTGPHGRGSRATRPRPLRLVVTDITKRGLLVVGVVASLALTADQVRAGSPRAEVVDAPLSVSLPGLMARPATWLASLSGNRAEAASLVLFGLCLLGSAQILARRRTSSEPAARTTPAPLPFRVVARTTGDRPEATISLATPRRVTM